MRGYFKIIIRAPPKEVIGRRLELLSKFESNVEKYDRFESFEMYKKSCEAIGKFVDCDSNDIALVRNTTTGINCIVTSLGQRIKSTLLMSHAYAAMKNTMIMHSEKYNSKIVTVGKMNKLNLTLIDYTLQMSICPFPARLISSISSEQLLNKTRKSTLPL